MSQRQAAIDEIIFYIQQNLDTPLTLDILSRHAAYSPYHFTRLFQQQTGLTPMYYVSALRLQKAKELLVQTDLKVRDISLEIGQKSLGTFTTRFTQRGGLSLAMFWRSVQSAAVDGPLFKPCYSKKQSVRNVEGRPVLS